jgi:hypothetical protein
MLGRANGQRFSHRQQAMCRYQIPKVSAFAAVQGCAIFAQSTVFLVGAAVLVVQMTGVLPNIVAKQNAFVDH